MFNDMMLVQLQRPVLYSTLLYYIILNCTVCTVLYCTVRYCTVAYCTLRYYTLLHPRLTSLIFLIARPLQIGIPGSIFIHTSGFIGGHATREGALAMAVQVTDSPSTHFQSHYYLSNLPPVSMSLNTVNDDNFYFYRLWICRFHGFEFDA